MQVLVSLKFGDGDFTNGFPEISIFTSKVDSQHFQEIEIQLPPAPEIPKSYQNWQNKYINLFETLGIRVLTPISVPTSFGLEHENFVRGFNKNILTNFSLEEQKQEFEESKKECDSYASYLRTEVNQSHSPYKGLSAFQEEDAEYFFGREKFIADLVEAANSKPLVPVVGASGSGKSSVVFAGLVPRLREYGMQIVSFRPGHNPFDALAIALSSHIRSTVIGTQESNPIRTKGSNPNSLETSNEFAIPTKINLFDNEKALCRLIENIVASNEKTSSPRFILIADQFEELYTLTSETQQQPFLNLLLHAVKFAPNFSLVLTLRADFYGHAISNRDFGIA